MSDEMNYSNLEDNDDDVSADDLEAAESFSLKDLGIDPRTTPFEDLLKIYREQVGICNDYAAKQKSGSSDPNDVASVLKANVSKTLKGECAPEVKATVDSLKSAGSQLAEAVFTKFPVTEGLTQSAVMLEQIENLMSLMRQEYEYHFNKAVQAEKDAKGIKSTPSEQAIRAKLACIKLKGTKPGEGLINARIQMAKVMDEEIPDNLYKTGGVRNGFNTDIVPRLPRLDIETGTASSSGTTHLVFRFKTTGSEEIVNCAETTYSDVAHNVISKGAYRVSGKDIERKLKSAKLGLGATDTEWNLEFETGTLFGRKA